MEYRRVIEQSDPIQLNEEIEADSYAAKVDCLNTYTPVRDGEVTVEICTSSDLTDAEQTEFEATVDSHTP